MRLLVWDTVGRPGIAATLAVRLETDWFCRAIPERPIRVRPVSVPAAAGAPAAPVELVADRRGRAEFAFTPPTPGIYVFEFESPGRHGAPPARGVGVIGCREPNRPAVAVDIDGTLTNRPTSLRTGIAGAVIRDEFTASAAARLAGTFDWLYISGRRRGALAGTRDWLVRHGLPGGPVLLHMLPIPVPGFLSARWKTRVLTRLRPEHAGLTAGIGNTAGDAAAYAAAGMLPVIFTDRPMNAVAVSSWRQVEELLAGDRLPLTTPANVRLGGSVETTITPRGAECSVVLRGPAGSWEPPPGQWPVLREGLLRRLAERPAP